MHDYNRRIRHIRKRIMAASRAEGADSFSDRVFRLHGGLRFYVLYLLSVRPMNGSEVIDEIESRSLGAWRPSPGSIYPILGRLETEKLISRNEDGTCTATDEGTNVIKLIRPGSNDGGRRVRDGLADTIQKMEDLTAYLEDNISELDQYSGRLGDLKKRIDSLIQGVK